MLQPLLTSSNHEALLRKAGRRSKREIERLVAGLSPTAPGPKDLIRALPAAQASPVPAGRAPLANEAALVFEPPEIAQDPPAHEPPSEAPGRVLFTFAAGEAVRGLFEQARDLLRHKFPSGTMEEVIGEALRRLVDEELPGAKSRRPAPAASSAARYIPKWIEDHVWRRDNGRCSFVGPEGLRCGETGWLELDHVKPWALGGRSDDPDNIRLLCRAHNQSEARRIFGAPPKTT